MNLNLITEKLTHSEFAKNFIKELGNALKNYDKKGTNLYEIMDKNIDEDTHENGHKDINDNELTEKEELELERKKFDFLQEYFESELLDISQGEMYIVTDKYESDNRYKVAQYKDNLEYKYIALEESLTENVQLGDIVRKVGESYIYDKQATQYVRDSLEEIKQEIINNRNI